MVIDLWRIEDMSECKPVLTKREFERQLAKVFTTPVPPDPSRKKLSPEASGTLVEHPSDGCNETHTNPDRTEGT